MANPTLCTPAWRRPESPRWVDTSSEVTRTTGSTMTTLVRVRFTLEAGWVCDRRRPTWSASVSLVHAHRDKRTAKIGDEREANSYYLVIS
jgi:hypothetical protein